MPLDSIHIFLGEIAKLKSQMSPPTYCYNPLKLELFVCTRDNYCKIIHYMNPEMVQIEWYSPLN